MSTADLIKRCFCPPTPPLAFQQAHREGKNFALLSYTAVWFLNSLPASAFLQFVTCDSVFLWRDPALSEDAPLWGRGGGFGMLQALMGSRGDQNGRGALNTGPCVIDSQREIHLHVEAHLWESRVRSGALPLSTKSRRWFAAGRAVALAQMLKLARSDAHQCRGERDVSAPLQGS